MGTYLGFRVNDKKRKAAGKWLAERQAHISDDRQKIGLWSEEDREIELAKGDYGSPDFYELGEGQIKLSGREEDLSEIYDILEEAREKFGLECHQVPSNVGDYISEERQARLFDLPHWKALWREDEEDDERWRTAQATAVTAARAELGSGAMLAEGWGVKPLWLTLNTRTTQSRPMLPNRNQARNTNQLKNREQLIHNTHGVRRPDHDAGRGGGNYAPA